MYFRVMAAGVAVVDEYINARVGTYLCTYLSNDESIRAKVYPRENDSLFNKIFTYFYRGIRVDGRSIFHSF